MKPKAVGYLVGTVCGLKILDVDLNSLKPISGQDAGHLTDGVIIVFFFFNKYIF